MGSAVPCGTAHTSVFCTCFWNRISSHAVPVPIPILSLRYFFVFWFSTILCRFGFFTFLVLMRVNPLLTGGLGQEVPTRFSGITATGSCTPSWTSIRHLMWKFEDDGPDIFRVIGIDFCYVTFWLFFLAKLLNLWKLVKNRVFKSNAKKNRKAQNYQFCKTAISDF